MYRDSPDTQVKNMAEHPSFPSGEPLRPLVDAFFGCSSETLFASVWHPGSAFQVRQYGAILLYTFFLARCTHGCRRSTALLQAYVFNAANATVGLRLQHGICRYHTCFATGWGPNHVPRDPLAAPAGRIPSGTR